ncbi:NAD(P)-dependent alcohol dehydrogenase [Roseibacillus persicicus]|uniref:NADPH-dependent aldehyde reductase Ahr n=1 Tax=Roseibacillus persicicus TaxID=454148 RepID=UPI00398B596F
MKYQAYAADLAEGKLSIRDWELGELGPNEVDIDVDYCGLCHSDVSMLKNHWEMTGYPIVPGHEVVGRVSAKGKSVAHLEVGQRVGLGWLAGSCGTCQPCLGGHQNLCADSKGTIVGRAGGFAESVRAEALWAIPLPDGVDSEAAGPLFCGGITVFNPIVQNNISPMDRVAVVGIGGLGHMALQFLNKWGCEVTAFSTSPDKEDQARELGAHHFVNSRDDSQLDKVAGSYDLILSTVNVELDWEKYVAALRPQGTLHLVGAAPKVESSVFALIQGQKSISASPVGSPGITARMVEFSARHQIAPKVEVMPMSQINEAFDKLEKDKPAHRIVLKADFN